MLSSCSTKVTVWKNKCGLFFCCLSFEHYFFPFLYLFMYECFTEIVVLVLSNLVSYLYAFELKHYIKISKLNKKTYVIKFRSHQVLIRLMVA